MIVPQSNEDHNAVRYGCKLINCGNWNQVDRTFVFTCSLGGEDWVAVCSRPQLNSSVPEQIAALFEVARGSIIYSWFYYPLMTLGAEQLQRVLEAAARERLASLTRADIGIDQPRNSKAIFSEVIAELKGLGVITPEQFERWDITRTLRNLASHPKDQMILPPGTTLGALHTAAELINDLFR